MAAVTKNFTAVSQLSDELVLRQGETLTYAASGTFVGTLVLEVSRGRNDWQTIATISSVSVATHVVERAVRRAYRLRCSAYTSGTIAGALSRSASDTASVVRSIELQFFEAGAGTYTASAPLPAGATVLDIIVNGVALWTAATSAAMDVGDGADADGYFAAIDLKATDLLAGESISFAQAGGKAGAYIANSQVSPRYSATARVISAVVTSVGAGTAGRTRVTVVYQLPLAATVVTAVQT